MNQVKFDTKVGVLDKSSVEEEINSFDLNAFEASVQIKEKLGGVVTAISIGPRLRHKCLQISIIK
jgi:electron transfer flavoprotein beta subunit